MTDRELLKPKPSYFSIYILPISYLFIESLRYMQDNKSEKKNKQTIVQEHRKKKEEKVWFLTDKTV